MKSWPPGGNLGQNIPTAQNDYDEAYQDENRFKTDDVEMNEEEKPDHKQNEEDKNNQEEWAEETEISNDKDLVPDTHYWEDQIDDRWIEKKDDLHWR